MKRDEEIEYTYQFVPANWGVILISYMTLFGSGTFVLIISFKSANINDIWAWIFIGFFIISLLHFFHRFVHLLSTMNWVDFYPDHIQAKGLLRKGELKYSDLIAIKKSGIRPRSIDLIYHKDGKQKTLNIGFEYDKNVKDEMDYAFKLLEVLYSKAGEGVEIDKESIEGMLRRIE
jgi:hypothetical protein